MTQKEQGAQKSGSRWVGAQTVSLLPLIFASAISPVLARAPQPSSTIALVEYAIYPELNVGYASDPLLNAATISDFVRDTSSSTIPPAGSNDSPSEISITERLASQLQTTMSQLDGLKKLEVETEVPLNGDLSTAARNWLWRMYSDALTARQTWYAPSVNVAPDGNIEFEWWSTNTGRSLLIQIEGISAEFGIYWGDPLNLQSVEGSADSSDVRQKLWSWITGDKEWQI